MCASIYFKWSLFWKYFYSANVSDSCFIIILIIFISSRYPCLHPPRPPGRQPELMSWKMVSGWFLLELAAGRGDGRPRRQETAHLSFLSTRKLVPQIDPSVPQPVVQSQRRPLLGSLNVKLGPRRNYHKGRAAIRHYTNQTACPLWPLRRGPNFTLRDRGVNAHLA